MQTGGFRRGGSPHIAGLGHYTSWVCHWWAALEKHESLLLDEKNISPASNQLRFGSSRWLLKGSDRQCPHAHTKVPTHAEELTFSSAISDKTRCDYSSYLFQSVMCRILTFTSMVVHSTLGACVFPCKGWTAVWQRWINITPDSLQWAGCKMELSQSHTQTHTHTHTHWRLYAFSSTLCQFAATLAHLHLPNASACCSGFPISGNGESNSLLSKFTVSSFHKRSSMNPSGCSPCVVHLTPMVQMPLRHVHAPKISLLALSFSALLLQLVIWQLKIPLRRM